MGWLNVMEDGGWEAQYVTILTCLVYPPTSFYVTASTSMLSVVLIPLVGPLVANLPLRFYSLTASLPFIVLRFSDVTPLS